MGACVAFFACHNCLMTKNIIAIAYDFDETLTPDYMQHNSFLPDLGFTDFNNFWTANKEYARQNDMDEILSYMFMMLREASYQNKSIKREAFINHGKGIKFYEGVEEWFDRINSYGKAREVEVQHYVISSGLREMIDGTSIRKHFVHVYASGFLYNQDEIAVWPATAVNYTNKTQHLFRINKGIFNSWDNKSVNQFVKEEARPVPFENIIYIGDGDTDIPAMKMTKHYNGTAIAVYDSSKPDKKKASDERIEQGRADHSVAADYREGSEIDVLVKKKIDSL